MGQYYSPDGNCEIWEQKPLGYFTQEEAVDRFPELFRGTVLDKQLMAEIAAARAAAEEAEKQLKEEKNVAQAAAEEAENGVATE